GPVIGVFEALVCVGLWRSMQQAPRLELVRLQEASGLCDEVVDKGRRVFFDQLDRPRLRAEHLRQRRSVKIVAGRLAAGRMRFDQYAEALFLRYADPRLHDAVG